MRIRATANYPTPSMYILFSTKFLQQQYMKLKSKRPGVCNSSLVCMGVHLLCCVSWLYHSIGTGHRSRASQITPTSALSFIHLSLYEMQE